jgi:hypothetical protein
MLTDPSRVHPTNADCPIDVIAIGVVTVVNMAELPNAATPSEVSVLSKDTVSKLQFVNAKWEQPRRRVE